MNQKYIIKKMQRNANGEKLKSFYYKKFTTREEAIRKMTDWAEFDASLLQASREENTIYICSMQDKMLNIIKIVFTKNDYKDFSRLYAELVKENNEDIRKKLEETIDKGTKQVVYTYFVDVRKEVLPEVNKEEFSFIAFMGEVMLPERFIKSKLNIKESNNIKSELLDFTIEVAKTISIPYHNDLKIKAAPGNLPKFMIYQNDKIICTTILYSSIAKEIILK